MSRETENKLGQERKANRHAGLFVLFVVAGAVAGLLILLDALT